MPAARHRRTVKQDGESWMSEDRLRLCRATCTAAPYHLCRGTVKISERQGSVTGAMRLLAAKLYATHAHFMHLAGYVVCRVPSRSRSLPSRRMWMSVIGRASANR